jgi:hypothetical protein
MRVVVVYLPAGEPNSLAAIAKSMVRALEAKGHRAEGLEARKDEYPRLTGYDYVILGTEGMGFGGKIPPRVREFLAQAGSVSGKRSMAFVRKTGLFPAKALKGLMAAMESEGMLVNCAEIVAGAEEAAAAVGAAPVERY